MVALTHVHACPQGAQFYTQIKTISSNWDTKVFCTNSATSSGAAPSLAMPTLGNK
jgi:hypothetical protein